MILYFTATGNSRWIAELLAEAMHDTAVSIVIAHAHGSPFAPGRFHGNQAVRPDAEAAVAQGFNGLLVQHGGKFQVTVVHHDKVISGARHLVEMKQHNSKLCCAGILMRPSGFGKAAYMNDMASTSITAVRSSPSPASCTSFRRVRERMRADGPLTVIWNLNWPCARGMGAGMGSVIVAGGGSMPRRRAASVRVANSAMFSCWERMVSTAMWVKGGRSKERRISSSCAAKPSVS